MKDEKFLKMRNISLFVATVIAALLIIALIIDTKRAKEIYTLEKVGDVESLPPQTLTRENLVISTTGISNTINPLTSTYLDGDNVVINAMYEALISLDASGFPKRQLAKKMEVSQDGKTYTFILDDANFSDGSPLTSEDVRISLTEYCNLNYDNKYSKWLSNLVGYEEYTSGLVDKIGGIEINSDDSISFTFKNKKGSNLWAFLAPIIQAESIHTSTGNMVDDNLPSLGTGQYKIDEISDDKITLIENEYYTGTKPETARIDIIAANKTSAVPLVDAGVADFFTYGYDHQFINAALQSPVVDLYSYDGSNVGVLGINFRNSQLQDLVLRQAIAYAIDKKAISEKLYSNASTIPVSIIPNNSWMTPKGLNLYEYNPQKSIDMLEKSGYLLGNDGIRAKDGIPLSFRLIAFNAGTSVEIVEEIIRNLSEVGIAIDLEQKSYNKLKQSIYEDYDFDLYYTVFSSSLEPDFFDRFSIDSKNNIEGWENTESQQLLAAIYEETDFNKRTKLYHNWLKLVNKELPLIPIDLPKNFIVASPRKDISVLLSLTQH